jgi:hypothetical protein
MRPRVPRSAARGLLPPPCWEATLGNFASYSHDPRLHGPVVGPHQGAPRSPEPADFPAHVDEGLVGCPGMQMVPASTRGLLLTEDVGPSGVRSTIVCSSRRKDSNGGGDTDG